MGSCAIKRRQWVWLPILIILTAFAPAIAKAATIVALGASSAAGQGVEPSQAWPAQLERMLRAKGYDVSVVVSAIPGDTSSGILSRVDGAVPDGTAVVIFDSGYSNDRRQKLSSESTADNVAQIRKRIAMHGARPIMNTYVGIPRQMDGIHPTAEGHLLVATRLYPKVVGMLHKRR